MCCQSATVCLVKSPALEDVAKLSLAERLRVLPDPRRRRGVRHPFVAVLLVAASAVVATRARMRRSASGLRMLRSRPWPGWALGWRAR